MRLRRLLLSTVDLRAMTHSEAHTISNGYCFSPAPEEPEPVYIQSRLHEADCSGQMLETTDLPHIDLPMEFAPN